MLGMAEIVTIIADNTKTFPISQRVLAIFVANGNASRIQITPVSAVGALLMLCGGLVRVICYRQLGKHFTFELTIQADHKLVTTGPYAVVRHPAYTGALLVYIGIFCFHGSPGSWLRESGVLETILGKILVCSIIAIMGIPFSMMKGRWEKEDEMLKKEFGQQWNDWASRVRYVMIPGIL
jgi:protein-S-isoprenylcysteine O-methyltransferase Ste14